MHQVAHDCTIIGEGGAYWPLPTFRVVAADRPTEPLTAKSCTGCWTQVRAAVPPVAITSEALVHTSQLAASHPGPVDNEVQAPSLPSGHDTVVLMLDTDRGGSATQVLKRICAEIEARRRAGEALPPPPKTAIAGPEYFGLNQPEVWVKECTHTA